MKQAEFYVRENVTIGTHGYTNMDGLIFCNYLKASGTPFEVGQGFSISSNTLAMA